MFLTYKRSRGVDPSPDRSCATDRKKSCATETQEIGSSVL
jgi:hypothetical protein